MKMGSKREEGEEEEQGEEKEGRGLFCEWKREELE